MTIEYGYCGSLQRSADPGSNASFNLVGYVTEPQFPASVKEIINLTDSRFCTQDSGYTRKMPSPKRELEDVELTIHYESDDAGHQLIIDDYNAKLTPDTAHYWRWIDVYGNPIWECKAYVTKVQNVAAMDTPLQLTFTLTFTGKPTYLQKLAVA